MDRRSSPVVLSAAVLPRLWWGEAQRHNTNPHQPPLPPPFRVSYGEGGGCFMRTHDWGTVCKSSPWLKVGERHEDNNEGQVRCGWREGGWRPSSGGPEGPGARGPAGTATWALPRGPPPLPEAIPKGPPMGPPTDPPKGPSTTLYRGPLTAHTSDHYLGPSPGHEWHPHTGCSSPWITSHCYVTVSTPIYLLQPTYVILTALICCCYDPHISLLQSIYVSATTSTHHPQPPPIKGKL